MSVSALVFLSKNAVALVKIIVCIFLLGFLSTQKLYAECACFELEGEFGEEIKAVLKKYAKDVKDKDSKNIDITSDQDSPQQDDSDSFVGSKSLNSSSFTTNTGAGYDVQRGQKLYNRDCASCHGDKAQKPIRTRPGIVTWDAEKIIDELRSYQTRDYEGQSRFVKEQLGQRYRKQDMKDIAYYIQTLKTK